mgnify:CR=1 FL=1|tara:strand:+ start:418 stop:657 length:240 start_codon:yes stop_codon:yes gene_type:complete
MVIKVINMTWKDRIKKEDDISKIPLEEIGQFLMETLDKRLPFPDEEGLHGLNRKQRESIKKLRRSISDALDEVNGLVKR